MFGIINACGGRGSHHLCRRDLRSRLLASVGGGMLKSGCSLVKRTICRGRFSGKGSLDFNLHRARSFTGGRCHGNRCCRASVGRKSACICNRCEKGIGGLSCELKMNIAHSCCGRDNSSSCRGCDFGPHLMLRCTLPKGSFIH